MQFQNEFDNSRRTAMNSHEVCAFMTVAEYVFGNTNGVMYLKNTNAS